MAGKINNQLINFERIAKVLARLDGNRRRRAALALNAEHNAARRILRGISLAYDRGRGP